jgi:hypothetical protein
MFDTALWMQDFAGEFAHGETAIPQLLPFVVLKRRRAALAEPKRVERPTRIARLTGALHASHKASCTFGTARATSPSSVRAQQKRRGTLKAPSSPRNEPASPWEPGFLMSCHRLTCSKHSPSGSVPRPRKPAAPAGALTRALFKFVQHPVNQGTRRSPRRSERAQTSPKHSRLQRHTNELRRTFSTRACPRRATERPTPGVQNPGTALSRTY